MPRAKYLYSGPRYNSCVINWVNKSRTPTRPTRGPARATTGARTATIRSVAPSSST